MGRDELRILLVLHPLGKAPYSSYRFSDQSWRAIESTSFTCGLHAAAWSERAWARAGLCARVRAAFAAVRGTVESRLGSFPPRVPALPWQRAASALLRAGLEPSVRAGTWCGLGCALGWAREPPGPEAVFSPRLPAVTGSKRLCLCGEGQSLGF